MTHAHRAAEVEEPRVDPHPEAIIGTQVRAGLHHQRFGFDADEHPPYLPMALGAGLVTPLQMAGAYLGVCQRRLPHQPVSDREVDRCSAAYVVAQAQPLVAGRRVRRTRSTPRNAYIMNSLLQTRRATGTGARPTC